MVKMLFKLIAVILALFAGLFCVYFFNLDMKLIVNVIAPFFEKEYDRRDRKQFV